MEIQWGLPEIFGCSIYERKDLKIKYSAASELEQLRDELNARLSVSTSTWNNCEMFKSFQFDVIDHLSRAIGKKKRSLEACISAPFNFVLHFFVPALRLTGLFEEKCTEGVILGNPGSLVHRFLGSIQGLKMVGVHSKNHSKWANPFLKVEYFSAEEAEFAPYYDKLKFKNGGTLPYHVDVFALDSKQLLEDAKVKFELGEDYNFDCSPYKVRHDMHLGHVQADKTSDLYNFGVKKWWIASTGEQDVLVDIIKPPEGSQTCTVYFECNITSANFTGAIDLESGAVAQGLKDV